MYKKIILLLSFLPSLMSNASPITHLGSLEFPQNISSSPCLTAYYNGAKIAIQDGSYSFKEDSQVSAFYLLFTLDPLLPFSIKEGPNTIKSFKFEPKTGYKCFKLTKNNFSRFAAGSQGAPWAIQELSLAPDKKNKKLLKIPKHTMIVLIDPSYIDHLTVEPWESHGNTSKLPRIVFKPTILESNFNDMCASGLFASLDLDPFHKKPNLIKEQQPNNPQVIVSVLAD